MSSGGRFLRGKTRLVQREQVIHDKKSINKRIGVINPEDTIKIPIIGEWNVGEPNPQTAENRATTTLKNVRPFPKNLPLTETQIQRLLETPEQETIEEPPPQITHKTLLDAPIKIQLPKVLKVQQIAEPKLHFPDGTATTDLSKILRSSKRSPTKPLPPLHQNDSELGETEFLPLEYFDDIYLQEYSADELLKTPHAVSKYITNGETTWEPCTALSYSSDTSLFTIEWDANHKTKRVPRFNILFDIEDPQKFHFRVEAAKKARMHYQASVRLDARLSLMPTDKLEGIPDKSIKRIRDLAGKSYGKYAKMLRDMETEVRNDYKVLSNKMSFLYEIEHNPLIPNREEFFLLKKDPKKIYKYYGLIMIVTFDFKELLSIVQSNHLFAHKYIQKGIFRIWRIFQNAKETKFLNDEFESIMALEDFVTRQYQHINDTTNSFKASIQQIIDQAISRTIKKTPKEDEADKTNKLLQKMGILTARMLHTILYEIVVKTLDDYCGLFNVYLTESEIPIDPKFFIEFYFNETTKRLEFTPSTTVFQDQLLSLLQQLETTVSQLPVLKSEKIDLDTSSVSFQDCNDLIEERRKKLNEELQQLFEKLDGFLENNKYIEKALSLDSLEYVVNFDPDNKRPLDDYRKELNELQAILQKVTSELNPSYNISLFKVACRSFKDMSIAHISRLINSFLHQMRSIMMKTIKELHEEYDEIAIRLQKVPDSPEDLAEMLQYHEQVTQSETERSKRMESANERFRFLEEFKYNLENEDFSYRFETLQMPNKVVDLIEESNKVLANERIRLIRDLRQNQRHLENDTLITSEALDNFIMKYTDLDLAVEAADQINEIASQLQALRANQEKYNSHEQLFEFEPEKSRLLSKLVDDFTPIHGLWNLAREWTTTYDQWMMTPFPQLKSDQMSQFITTSSKTLIKLKKSLSGQRSMIEKVVVPLITQVDQFKQKMILLTKLKHPGIKTQHWEQISQIVGFSVMPSSDVTLQEFLGFDLDRWSDKISEIAGVAMQEYTIESTLDQMDVDLQTIKFITVTYKGSGHFILQKVDEIVSTMDDQIVTTQSLLTSPYISPVRQRATERLDFLKLSHVKLDLWIICQRNFLYLLPIFSGTTIQKKLLKEASDWVAVNKTWSSIMTVTHNHPEFLNVMHREQLKEQLETINKLLDSIGKGLNQYLETKRLNFPRFFFLSNEELISILSHIKDFDKIQESMPKLFEYVNTITVTKEMEITEMKDVNGEVVPLLATVDANTTEIEDWLLAFEEEMKNTLKDRIREALTCYASKKREFWIRDFPAQAILIANQILWTQQITVSFKGQKIKALKNLSQKFIEQLNVYTALVRNSNNFLMRQAISCLLIAEVHNRDIINYLIDSSVVDSNDFKWQQQLRYYWEDETVYIHSINNIYEYSYEYAGNSTRLVITPLTDRCYQTLLAAFKQNLSGAPSGPAGTGKTETVRDCAKALGRACVVYNCSENVTPEQMSQFFAGLSTSGAWSCFDEFNRINIEVLSVIAQQVRTIQMALGARSETFVIDHRTLKLNQNAAICITMNPGYAGRVELPDNLKALFRPCAMMIPDYEFICEILLFSGGFQTASQLSVKLVSLFQLFETQLSNQRHYDWGLRAMKSILETSANSKQKFPEMNESVLLINSVSECTKPRLVSADIPLFEGIMKDVFPSESADRQTNEDLIEKLKMVLIDNLELIPLEETINKSIEFLEIQYLRHGIMLVGEAMSMKTTSWKSSELALNLNQENRQVMVKHLNPKSITLNELYGSFNPSTSEWSDGVLSSAIRECSFMEEDCWKWIIVDGPVDSTWIESMNSLLDDNKVLCLPNNERIQITPKVKMIFEVGDLAHASPATVSRCGMVFYDQSSLSWTALADAWTQKTANTNKFVSDYLRELMKIYVPPMLQFITNDVHTSIPINPKFAVKNLLVLLDCYIPITRQLVNEEIMGTSEMKQVDKLQYNLYISKFSGSESSTIPIFETEQLSVIFERIFIFCLVWSFGGLLNEESRSSFDLSLKEQCEIRQCKCPFPNRLTVFDYYVDLSNYSWVIWSDGITNMNFTMKNPIYQQMIPTNENASTFFLSKLLISYGKNMMICGPETSKTLMASILMNDTLDPAIYDVHNLPISSCTTPSTLKSFMISFMHKHSGQFGPLPNQHLVFFFDNINTIQPEIYGAQPSLELLRQFHDYQGWYNTKTMEFLNITGTSIYNIMGQPGGGLYNVPDRLLRHYFYLYIPKYTSPSIQQIMQNMMSQHFNKYQPNIKEMIKIISAATVDVFDCVNKHLLPVPSKMHYIFGIRNIIRVVRGLLMVNPQFITTEQYFMKLWFHEMSREFCDRLNTNSDRQWFQNQLIEMFPKHFKIQWEIVHPGNFLMFNMFSDGTQRYKLVTCTQDQVLEQCIGSLEQYNSDSTKEMKITLFHEAVDHISSIVRVLGMEKGHMMLLGVKSSGRKSFSRLALYMTSSDSFEITLTRGYSINDWKEDLKTLLKQCGVQDVSTGFIISDSQIIYNEQLEDISNLMMYGMIPNLFQLEDIDAIKQEILASEISTDIDCMKLFKDRILRNLHIIFVVSPYGSVFKEIILHFPIIRSESIIDYYLPWSQNALESVATASLTGGSIGSPDLVNSIVAVCVKIHQSVEEWSTKFLNETKRFTAVTPSRFFELLSTFHKKLVKKQLESAQEIRDYESGVTKIKTTRNQIEQMSIQLDREIPLLEKTRKEVEVLLEDLKVKRAEVQEMKEKVEEQSQEAEKEASLAEEANRIAQEQFEIAQPLLQSAHEAVQRLDKDSLVNIKKLHAPSAGMKETFEAIAIMFGKQPKKVEVSPGVKEDDYWPEVIALLNDVQFVKNVTNFKMENITKETINKLKKYIPTNKTLRNEKKKQALASFLAVGALYDWVCASFDYWFVYQDILPKKKQADEAKKKLEESQKSLAAATAQLEEIKTKLKELVDKVEGMQKKEKELTESVENTQIRLARAQKIMSGLTGEFTRWSETAENLRKSAIFILGDTILISGVLTYFGPFSPSYRFNIINQWKHFLQAQGIKFSQDFSIESSLGNDIQIRDWIIQELPNDQHSIENALIITQNENSIPLLIDPQFSGTRWLKAIEGEQTVVLTFDQSDFLTKLRVCVSTGLPVIIENVGLKLDHSISPLLDKEISKIDGKLQVQLGGELISYNENFRLYLSTKYPNPHFTPEVCSQIALINFTTTFEGLTDLLLNNLLEVEREDLDKKRISIMETTSENMKKLKEIERAILNIVSNAGNDILDDDNVIQTLQDSQKTSANIEQQMQISEKTEMQIQQFKNHYQAVAERASLLYFCASDFGVIDPMYQFSLKWFVPLFRTAIFETNHSSDQLETILSMHKQIATHFYAGVSYSLFSRHKLLFSILMAFRILLSEKKISHAELAFFISPTATKESNQIPWISNEHWKYLGSLPSLNSSFKDVLDHMQYNKVHWLKYIEADNPEEMMFPYTGNITLFQKLLILRIFHLQRVCEGLRKFIQDSLGDDFIKPPTLNLQKIFKDSDCLSPLVFIIMPGIDPQDEIMQVATTMGFDRYLKAYSLGRGQGPGAEELITEAAEKGFWVLLQNCHLSLSWMPRLEHIITNLSPQTTHKRFRLCLVTMSDPDFPIGILYQSTKLIYEIPKGIRENVMRIYSQIDPDDYKRIEPMSSERRLTFQLALLHGIILERLQFGSLGWNIPYEFNPSDFGIARKHLTMFLNEAQMDEIPMTALSYVIGELDYGGRVTDSWDRRTLIALLNKYFVEENKSLKRCRFPPPNMASSLDMVQKVISDWPVQTLGTDVGLSENASTINSRNEVLKIFANLLEVQPTLQFSSNEKISEEQFAISLIESLLQEIPSQFNLNDIKKRFDLTETLNIILYHEIISYNNLISIMKTTLDNMLNGLQGLIIIDDNLETFLKCIKSDKIPKEWIDASYPSILSLHAYLSDLKKRINFIASWVRSAVQPVVFDLGAFFHPDEFLNGIKQIFSRKRNIPYDTLNWQTDAFEEMADKPIDKQPEEGVYIKGLVIEGAKWDSARQYLVECGVKDLNNFLPVMHLKPTEKKNLYDMKVTYECPVYRTQKRGTSAMDIQNYILSLYLPTPRTDPSQWVLRSVAAFLTTE